MKRKNELDAQPPTLERPKPPFVAFGLKKRDGKWHAIAVRIRGREVVEERVLDSHAWLEVAEDTATKASYDFNHFELDPFREVVP